MSDKIQAAIVGLITFVPGIQGISTIDLTKSNIALNEEDWAKGVSISEGKKGFDVSIALIIKRDVSARTISQELDSAIRIMAKQEKVKIDKINIYVRGVK